MQESGTRDVADTMQCKASVYGCDADFDTRLPYYMACPIPSCKGKKLIDNNGSLVCGSCQSENVAGIPKFMVGFHIADHTGSIRATAFNDAEVSVR